MKTLICLKGNFEAQPIVARVHALGHRVVLVDPDPACAARGLADVYVQADHYDPAATVAALGAVPGLAPDGVLCCAGDTPHTAAAVADRFGLPGLTPFRAALSVDKWAQKVILKDVVPVPEFVLPVTLDGSRVTDGGFAVDHFWNRGHWPIVVKPRDSRGARGVTLVQRREEVPAAIAEAYNYSEGIVIEEYLTGPQLSTESVVVEGKVLFTAIALRNYDRFEHGDFGPHPVEDGFSMPYGDDALRAEVDDVLARACAALGWKTLSVKADLIIYQGRVVILELAARLSGGFLSTHGTALAYGVEFVNMAIRLALGHTFDAPRNDRPRQYVCQRYVFPDIADIGRRVKGFDLPDHDADFATFAIRPGDVIAPVVSHGQRWGQALATGATADEARARAEAAVAAMKRAVVLA